MLSSFGVFRNINKLPWKGNSAIIHSCFFSLDFAEGGEWQKMAIGKMLWLSPHLFQVKRCCKMMYILSHSLRPLRYLECRSCLQL